MIVLFTILKSMTSLNTSKTMSRGKALKLIKINLPQLPISGRRFYFSRLLNKKRLYNY